MSSHFPTNGRGIDENEVGGLGGPPFELESEDVLWILDISPSFPPNRIVHRPNVGEIPPPGQTTGRKRRQPVVGDDHLRISQRLLAQNIRPLKEMEVIGHDRPTLGRRLGRGRIIHAVDRNPLFLHVLILSADRVG
jgi:hypothetical protein